jgi:hypothetical protein
LLHSQKRIIVRYFRKKKLRSATKATDSGAVIGQEVSQYQELRRSTLYAFILHAIGCRRSAGEAERQPRDKGNDT